MRYIKTQKTYKASNVTLKIDREEGIIEAYSYNWWKFVAVINGKVVFNNHPYSPSTQRQQRKVRKILDREGILIDHFVDSRLGLNDTRHLADAVQRLTYRIMELDCLINTKGTRKAKNEERKAEIEMLKAKIEEIKSI